MKRTAVIAWMSCLLLHFGSAWANGQLPPPTPPDWNYQGLWWGSPEGQPPGREPGWGISITHQETTLFATWFTYDDDGDGTWLVMPNLARVPGGWVPDTYTGSIYRTSGPAFDAEPWNPSLVEAKEVGSATIAFALDRLGRFTYTVNGVTQIKDIGKQVFSSPVPVCVVGGPPGSEPNYTALWWTSPAGSESGWGLNIAHQGDILFATWFTYDMDGKTDWLVMSNGARVGDNVYSGTLYRTRGPAFSATPWDPTQVHPTDVGAATLAFSGEDEGLFAYILDGVSQSKPITRQVFASPPSVCR